MGQDETIPVLRDGTDPFHVCVEGWDGPNFLFDWRGNMGWNDPISCLIEGMK